MRQEINYNKNVQGKTHTHKHTEAKQSTNGHWRTQKRNLKISEHKWKWKNNNPKSMGCNKSSSKRVVYSNTRLPQETRKISSNLTSHLKELEKEKNQKLVEGKKS